MNAARILIVDDDPALLRALPEALQLRVPALTIDMADSAALALERIEQIDYDAIISAVSLPWMDGLALLKQIRELRPETPTLLMSRQSTPDLALLALRGGAYDVIQQPFDHEYVVAALQRALHTRVLRRQVWGLAELLRQREAELETLKRQKDEFLSIASHELRTPLTSIKALTQLTKRQLERVGVPMAAHMVRMERSIKRMEQLINDLLDVSRIEAGKLAIRPEQCQLQMLFQQVVDEQMAASEREVIFDAPEEPVETAVDVDRVSQMLVNLLSNAFKYSPPDCPVTVTLRQEPGVVLLAVRDEGSGIPAAELPRIFDRFYRVPGIEVQSGSGVGLGLGLHICREIVERHGGQIWAESAVGQGSTFFVLLPLAAAFSQQRLAPDQARVV